MEITKKTTVNITMHLSIATAFNLLVVCSCIRPEYTYPTNLGHWKVADLNNLKCPETRYDVYIPAESTKRATKFEVLQGDPTHKYTEGYLCQQIEFSTTCYRGFFGSDTRTVSTAFLSVDGDSCIKQLHNFVNGQSTGAKTPEDADCYWMSSTERKVSGYVFVEHKQEYDPYRDSWVDTDLRGGVCVTSPCLTSHDSTLWIAASDKPSCHFTEHSGTLYSWNSTIVLTSDTHPYINLTGGCSITFCRKAGISGQGGVFLLLSDPVFPKCLPGQKVGEEEDSESWIPVDTEFKLERQDCFNTLGRITENYLIRPLDLGNLRPRFKGSGAVYKMDRGKLMITEGHYVAVNFTDSRIIGHSGDEEIKGLCYGQQNCSDLNGVIMVNGRYLIPDKSRLEDLYEGSILSAEKVVTVELHELIIGNVTHDVKRNTQESNFQTVVNKFSEFFGKIFSTWWSTTIFYVVLVLVSGIIIICIIKRIIKGKKSRSAII